jgi:hypothetical protein
VSAVFSEDITEADTFARAYIHCYSDKMFAQDTVLKVASAVDSQNVIHVRETPASGKTILSQLLRDHYLENHRNVFLLEIWKSLELFPGNDSWLDSFASAAKVSCI